MGTGKPGWSVPSLLSHLFCCMASGMCVYTVGKDSLNFFEYLSVVVFYICMYQFLFSYICICINLFGILLVCECAH